MKIGILDYGVGNVGSLANMIKYINLRPSLSNSVKDLSNNNVIFIPGVGTYDKAMSAISCNNNIEAIKDFVNQKDKFIVGICLGMQILFNSSEEGSSKGIGLFKDKIRSFRSYGVNQVPHMGWNYLQFEHNNHPVLENISENEQFYFVHSYALECRQTNQIIANTNYSQKIPAIIGRDNYIGVQFHPEKSGNSGQKFIYNWLKWKP